ncbi:MAG: hypothetical protein ACI4U4_00795 [Bacilli bacterium]
MNFNINNNGIRFHDYIEILDINDDCYIYNVFYSKQYGFCLMTEDEPLIKFLHLSNSKITSYYVNGEVKAIHPEIKYIKVDNKWLERKQKGFSIEGTLLQYDEEMGIKYNLNEEEYYNKFPKEYNNSKIRERIKTQKKNN